MATNVTCSCGTRFDLNSPEEDYHYVWSRRADGTRSNLGECPVKHSVHGAKSRLYRNGHTWFQADGKNFYYRGQNV